MNEVNEGVGIILARMETNPEEFFEAHRDSNKWRWIFSENLREVMTEPEKAAIFESMKRVRRLEITHKAIATILPQEEEEEKGWPDGSFGKVPVKSEGKKMIVNASQMEMMKRMSGGSR
jgi:hypothetical protein